MLHPLPLQPTAPFGGCQSISAVLLASKACANAESATATEGMLRAKVRCLTRSPPHVHLPFTVPGCFL
jgi:hypothetical protein